MSEIIDPSPPSSSSPLDRAFHEAAGWLSTSPAAAGAGNDVKLQIYGLYKVATSGSIPTGPAPSFFALPTTKAKHSAWVTAGQTHTSESAMRKYVEVASSLGWTPARDGGEEGGEGGEGAEGGYPRKRGGGTAGVGGGAVSVMQVEEREGEDEAHPIHTAAMDGALTDLERLLDEDPGLVNKQDEFGLTALHYAADRGHTSAVKVLLEKGADPSLTEEDGLTAYELASTSGQEGVMELLRGKKD